MPTNYEAIPRELRELKQWCVWRYEDKTKVPYQLNGKHADVTKPSTWTYFQSALEFVETNPDFGLGFIFSKKDKYAGIDLDASKVPEIVERQKLVFSKFDSYSEISPSGNGLHIIIKAELPHGRRRDKIEIYSHSRFFAMTGNVYHNVPIKEQQELATMLWEQMGVSRVINDIDIVDEKYTDAEILDQAANAANGDKFVTLHKGNWQDLYPSQSEADFALIDIIAYYTQARNQVVRIFRASALGKRQKANRANYVEWMLNRAFDNQPPQVDIDLRINEINEQIANLPATQEQIKELIDSERAFEFPPGLLGQIADYIYQSAPRPVRSIALTAAIGLMAGICGRAYNIEGSGLNQYLLMLAETGTGKEAMASGISRLMASITHLKDGIPAAAEFIGPSEISSGQALLKAFDRHSKSFVSVLGEFGFRLAQMSSSRANTGEIVLKRVLLDLYGKNGKGHVLNGSIYSASDKSTAPIESPSFSILSEATPRSIYEEMDVDLIEAGLLPRFTVFQYDGPRVPYNENHHRVKPSQELRDNLMHMSNNCLRLNSTNDVVNVEIEPDAKELLNRINKFCDDNINDATAEVQRHVWNRFHLKVMRMAALVAVGINPYYPVVTLRAVTWAANLINDGTLKVLAKFARNEMGKNTEETEQHREVLAKIKDYLKGNMQHAHKYMSTRTWGLLDKRIITHEYLSRRLLGIACFRKDRRGGNKALHAVVEELINYGYIEPIPKHQLFKQFGLSICAYSISDSQTILADR